MTESFLDHKCSKLCDTSQVIPLQICTIRVGSKKFCLVGLMMSAVNYYDLCLWRLPLTPSQSCVSNKDTQSNINFKVSCSNNCTDHWVVTWLLYNPFSVKLLINLYNYGSLNFMLPSGMLCECGSDSFRGGGCNPSKPPPPLDPALAIIIDG